MDDLIDTPGGVGVDSAPKVFGIGLSRTGTQTLNRALQMLGYEAAHYPPITCYRLGRALLDLDEAGKYDALTDIPVARFYKELDSAFPGSKFIMTVRNPDDWIESVERLYAHDRRVANNWFENFSEARTSLLLHYFGIRNSTHLTRLKVTKTRSRKVVKPLVRKQVYGCCHFDRERMLAAYANHLEDVLSYFAGREEDLLVMRICDGEGWSALCSFLGMTPPKLPFPRDDSHMGSMVADNNSNRDDKAAGAMAADLSRSLPQQTR